MNQYNKEDVDSPKADKKIQIKNLNEMTSSSKKANAQIGQGNNNRGVAGATSEFQMQEMGGTIVSREINQQMHPKLLKLHEKQLQSASQAAKFSKMVQPSPRFSGTNRLNQKY